MPNDSILALLLNERDKLNRAIEALQGPTKRAGRPSQPSQQTVADNAPKRKRKPLTAAQRKAHSKRMKAIWAARRAEG